MSLIVTGKTIFGPKVIPSFSPTDIAGCQLWLKADAGITKDSSNYVSQWADQSGNGNHAVQGTVINQPLLVNNEYNGNPTVRFNGSSSFIEGVITPTPNERVTIFFVAKQFSNTLNNGAILLNMSSEANDYINPGQIVVMANSPTSQIFYRGNGVATNSYSSSYNNNLCVFCIKIDGANPLTTYNSYINGRENVLTTSGNYVFSYDRYILACRYVGGAYGYFINIDFSEVIIYNSALSDIDRQLVESYLNTKYALY